MGIDRDVERVLRLYPAECQPEAAERFHSPNSFSGARLWRVETLRGPLCLRRWPREHPNRKRLEFIQAVLWHVHQEGFDRVPLPVETRHGNGYIQHDGHLWELTPWLPGEADYHAHPRPTRLQNALTALAEFHLAAHAFPLPEPGPTGSPGIAERVARLQRLLQGRLADLQSAITPQPWPKLAERARRLVTMAAGAGPRVLTVLEHASGLKVGLQPCLRDIWHAHVLFVDDEVTGLVDFGALRSENVAADVARLLGSLAGDDRESWRRGLTAYQAVRPLSADELVLITAFDRSTVVMGGLQWLEWIYLEDRQFERPEPVLTRVDQFVERLERLAQMLD